MANNYSQATVSPDFPVSVISDLELTLLATAGASYETFKSNGEDTYYFCNEEYFSEDVDTGFLDANDVDPDELTDGDRVYFDDADILRENITVMEIYQNILKRLPEDEYPCIIIQGADTCDKMRVDNFGGFAVFITRTEVDSISTFGWINDKVLGMQKK